MDIKIGLGCKDQALCDQIGVVIGYLLLGLFVGFVVYAVIKAIENRK